ncbi:hypothetical protein D3C81_1904580 [compost metagenome]
MDMAGIGEKPTMRSGPYFLIVSAFAAAMISFDSSHVARTKPPRPRMDLYCCERTGSWLIQSQAVTGSMVLRASRHISIRRPRTIGYFTRCAEYTYQE